MLFAWCATKLPMITVAFIVTSIFGTGPLELAMARRPSTSAFLEQETKQAYRSPVSGCEGLACVKQYVNHPDASYSWHDTKVKFTGVDKASSVRWTGYIINMTSQTWLTAETIEFPVWWHILVVIVPDNVKVPDWSTMIIEFGSDNLLGLEIIANRGKNEEQGPIVIDSHNLQKLAPVLKQAIWKGAHVATRTHTIAACLFNGMNEYQSYRYDYQYHKKRFQDDILSYSYYDFISHGGTEPERIVLLPMVKAVVRAMDTVSNFTNGTVKRFGVWGYSKLGETTWMTGAIDPRVAAIVPTAYIENPMDHGILPPVGPYEFLTSFNNTPVAEKLRRIINYQYWSSNLSVPKLLVMPTNDIWFNKQIPFVSEWWSNMPEPKSLLFLYSTHQSAIVQSASAVTAFFYSHILRKPMPQISYSFDHDTAVISAENTGKQIPSSVTLYSAEICFGLAKQPNLLQTHWEAAPLLVKNPLDVPDENKLRWNVSISFPENPCMEGGFISFSYKGPEEGYDPFEISTPVFLAKK